MLAVVGIFIAMFFWRLLVLTGAAAFERAGLVPSAAVFEARSALTGVGYTTSEAEVVVNDPASRQAASLLMIVGFVGPVTILGLFGFGFFLPTSSDFEVRAIVLALLIALFVLLAAWASVRILADRNMNWGVIIVNQAEARNGPSADYEVGFKVPVGREVRVLGQEGNWIAIGLTPEGYKGWIQDNEIGRDEP